MWEQVTAEDLDRAKQSLSELRTESLKRHAEELENLRAKHAEELATIETKQAELDRLNLLIEAFASELDQSGEFEPESAGITTEPDAVTPPDIPISAEPDSADDKGAPTPQQSSNFGVLRNTLQRLTMPRRA
jgi:hypothetical protein